MEPRKDNAAPRRRRVGLTPQVEHTILTYIEAGAFDHVAAEAAGIDARTFREWMARGEGRHPTRPPTPELRRFARAVREAQARARVAREVLVADRFPKYWLAHQGRSRPGRDGWTEPVPGGGSDETPAYVPTPEEAVQTFRVLVESGAVALPPCPDPGCRCGYHGEGPQEVGSDG